MKKVVIFAVSALAFVGLVVVSFFGYAAYVGSQLDASAKAYVDRNVPVILEKWSKDEFLQRASPQVRQALNDAQLDRMFAKMSQLGTLLSYQGARGEANMSVTSQNGKVVTASYVAPAVFEKGDAKVTVRLIQNDGNWQMTFIGVDSALFAK
jgi:hypothetical protein